MNNLEWINEQIKKSDKEIEYLEIKIIEDKKYPTLVEFHKERIEELKPILNHLLQIKTILEAWEIAKAKEIDLYDVITSQDTEEFNCDLYKDYQLTEEEFNKLKKALEVEDYESSNN